MDPLAAGDSDVLGKLDQADLAPISTAGSVPQGGVAVPLFRWRRVLLVQNGHPLAVNARADPGRITHHALISYESSTRTDSSPPACVRRRRRDPADRDDRARRQPDRPRRAGLGAGCWRNGDGGREDADLRILTAPAEIPECITWAVIPRGRDLARLRAQPAALVCPQLDSPRPAPGAGRQPDPEPAAAAGWDELTQSIAVASRSRLRPRRCPSGRSSSPHCGSGRKTRLAHVAIEQRRGGARRRPRSPRQRIPGRSALPRVKTRNAGRASRRVSSFQRPSRSSREIDVGAGRRLANAAARRTSCARVRSSARRIGSLRSWLALLWTVAAVSHNLPERASIQATPICGGTARFGPRLG